MKNIFVSSSLKIDKHKNLRLSNSIDWYNFFEKIDCKINTNYSENKNRIKKFAKNHDALILTGGGDISKFEKKKVNVLRDKFEINLFKNFLIQNKPIICICRGFQLIGSMYGAVIEKEEKSRKKRKKLIISKYSQFIKNKFLNVMCYHDYSIINLPQKFNVISKTEDGSIEIAELKRHKVLFLMFHPERYNKSNKEISNLIKKFLNGFNHTSSRKK